MHGDALLDDLLVVGLHVDVQHVLAVLLYLHRLRYLYYTMFYQDIVREIGVSDGLLIHFLRLHPALLLHLAAIDADVDVAVVGVVVVVVPVFLPLLFVLVVALLPNASLNAGPHDETAIEFLNTRNLVVGELFVQSNLVRLLLLHVLGE